MNKLTIKRTMCALAIAGAAFSANAAAPVDLGTLPIGATAFGGFVPPDGTFGDIFDFVLPANGGSSYNVVNLDLPIPGVDYRVLFSSMTLYSTGLNGLRGGGDDVLVAQGVASGLGNSDAEINFSYGPTTSPKAMYLVVAGVADGANGGIYSGAISVTPVPEPETWAMMLLGAGLVGFRLRNRSKKVASSRLV